MTRSDAEAPSEERLAEIRACVAEGDRRVMSDAFTVELLALVDRLRAERASAQQKIADLTTELDQCAVDFYPKAIAAAEQRGFARGVEAARGVTGPLVEQWHRFAKALRSEVDQGIYIRQSAESKLARVDVLRSNADQLERNMRLLLQPPAAELASADSGTISIVYKESDT